MVDHFRLSHACSSAAPVDKDHTYPNHRLRSINDMAIIAKVPLYGQYWHIKFKIVYFSELYN
ncbi:uncharacterized protein PHALS_06065 [Plasmopara halstedii]|uniref:Uncharacterized protein n=1 Tax=Plasmopara halstedii TaxID=4781 RepID=A0A0P1AB22_PLAHL|nr:uncharacterized protein PHALS_06065 [Plasmopara halstedii]CEG38023.1 hypothetical protein PHALS_06065 [Plasmopara halstedii]|eukprot:XP_024574392.1 hypothetical protein PHALS_06065 [Plasmopara halstedii]